jgi:hypothetical protein
MDEKDASFERYLIDIRIPREPFSKKPNTYETNENGEGEVSVYKIVEGRKPAVGEVRHITYAGWFRLPPKEGKSSDEFMRDIRAGLSTIVSQSD